MITIGRFRSEHPMDRRFTHGWRTVVRRHDGHLEIWCGDRRQFRELRAKSGTTDIVEWVRAIYGSATAATWCPACPKRRTQA